MADLNSWVASASRTACRFEPQTHTTCHDLTLFQSCADCVNGWLGIFCDDFHSLGGHVPDSPLEE